uniref:TonB-dependent receptor plug n=1 Tax=Sphingobacterium sp. (strain 21) TaxID=743722 RepID=F4C135_SPHS2
MQCIEIVYSSPQPLEINTIPKQYIILKGKVISSKDDSPLEGATVSIVGQKVKVLTSADGNFTIGTSKETGELRVTFVGYESSQTPFNSNKKEPLLIELQSTGQLDEVQIIGYGQTTKRLNTGSVSAISSEVIEAQPVTNILSALSGRMPGVFVQTTNGLPGGSINIQIRGKGSLTAGADPLYIIDGVPFASSSLVANTALAGGINGAINPLNSIHPSDIENITVLKDADATAIYGSRGANGVVLIETKRGKSGTSKVTLNSNIGFSKVSSYPSLLDLEDYLAIRREAYVNDNITPSSDPQSNTYAPDLMVWDTTSSTNWAKYFMGKTAVTSNTQLSVSGGNEQTNFYVAANYRSETSVIIGDNLYQRGGTQIAVDHRSPNKKFSLSSSLSLTKDVNRLANPVAAMEGIILLPPNFPLHNADGSLNWTTNINPLAAMLATTQSETDNVIANTSFSYKLMDNLKVKLNVGANRLAMKQVIVNPKNSQSPDNNAVSTTYFGDQSNNSFLVEPQLDYSLSYSSSTIKMLLGGTWQSNIKEGQIIFARNFNSEQMLENLASAGTVTPTNSYLEYRYASVFGRITYSYADRYIVNISGRRDGSSKFGINNRFGNFCAIGGAWIISNESWIKDHLQLISYSKLRASYGITGNDQIADYQYLSTYATSNYLYDGIVGLAPSRIANADFKWETNKKFEIGLEVGLFKDRLLLSINRFDNRSGNQLVNYALPWLTGFSSYQANLPAKIKNTGWEIELNSRNINKDHFTWSSSFNITFLRNKLLSFPGIENSSYANIYRIGESILRDYGYRFAYVDKETGSSQYELLNGQFSPSPPFENFYFTKGDRNPSFYGGLGNSLSYKNLQLEVFTQFSKQRLPGGLTSIGMLSNSFDFVKDRWQSKGEVTDVPKASTRNDTYYWRSSANYHDAAYIRIKNIALSIDLKTKWLNKWKISQLRLYGQGQNLFTIWNKNTALYDPESGASTNIPPLKSFVFGIQLTI